MMWKWRRARRGPSESRPDSVSVEASSVCAKLFQGCVLDIQSLPMVLTDGRVESIVTPEGAAIISQTCDIVQDSKAVVTVAAVARLNATDASAARSGRQPRFVHLPLAGEDLFADLDLIATVAKERMIGLKAQPGVDCDDLEQVRDLARRLGRRLSRFAFPDEVVPWLQPLQRYVQDRHEKNSAIGSALRSIVELRLQSEDWAAGPPFALTLHVIVRSGTVPSPEDIDYQDPPEQLSAWLAAKRTAVQVAERLQSTTDPVERYYLWGALGWALVDEMNSAGARNENTAIRLAVSSIESQLSSDDEFSLAQMRKSEMLDLDHLSIAAPL